MDLVLHTPRSNQAANDSGNDTMLRFRDFVNPGCLEKDMDFGRRLDAIIDAEAKGNVYLDLDRVKYLHAADIGRAVHAWKKLKDANRRLVLCNVEPFVSELLHITRVDTLMEIHSSGPFSFADAMEPKVRCSPCDAATPSPLSRALITGNVSMNAIRGNQGC